MEIFDTDPITNARAIPTCWMRPLEKTRTVQRRLTAGRSRRAVRRSGVSRRYLAVIFIACAAALSWAGCDPSDLDVSSDEYLCKVYADSLAGTDNPAMAIAAGNGRMFMTYGYNSYLVVANGLEVRIKSRPAVMATDNRGNLLWRSALPDAMESCAVVALDDGGCLVATHQYVEVNTAFSKDDIYLFRYDRNGRNTSVDSVSLLPLISSNLPDVSMLHAMRTSSGSILIYGNCRGQDDPYIVKGLAFEYTLGGGVQWMKTYSLEGTGVVAPYLFLTGCIQTAENGFLFIANFTYADVDWNPRTIPVVIQTTATGDTLWSRRYIDSNGGWTGNVIPAPNGNYRFCFTGGTMAPRSKPIAYIYEVTPRGDSVRSVMVDSKDRNCVNAIVPTDNGGCIAMVNQYVPNVIRDSLITVFVQTNTRKVVFDALLRTTQDAPFQTFSTDYLPTACRTSDGDIAYFGLRQPVGTTVYIPHLFIHR
jgi:hypothetical protein